MRQISPKQDNIYCGDSNVNNLTMCQQNLNGLAYRPSLLKKVLIEVLRFHEPKTDASAGYERRYQTLELEKSQLILVNNIFGRWVILRAMGDFLNLLFTKTTWMSYYTSSNLGGFSKVKKEGSIVHQSISRFQVDSSILLAKSR